MRVILKKVRTMCGEWSLILRFRKWGRPMDLDASEDFQKENLLDERSIPCPKELGNYVPQRVKMVRGKGKSTTAFTSEGLGAPIQLLLPTSGVVGAWGREHTMFWVIGLRARPCS